MINYNVISTGSKGNAVVINGSILIDCGVPFRALKDVHAGLRLVLLTHVHGDHFNCRTIKRLAQERPSLRFGCPDWLAGDLLDLVEPRNIDVYVINGGNNYYAYTGVGGINPFPLAHNVPNCGYKIIIGGERLLYATDTNSMNGIEAKNYDLYLLEANYGEEEITERIRQKREAGEFCHEWDVLKNHLSKEKADDWLYRNLGPNSRYVYLHGHEDEQGKVSNSA